MEDDNVTEANRDWHNSYASVIVTILYVSSDTRPYIYFSVHQCAKFIHKTKESHETDMQIICQYIQGTKYKCLLFNPYKKTVVIFMLVWILRDCGEMKILKSLFVLILGLYLW